MSVSTEEATTHPILGFVRALDGALDKVAFCDPVFMTPEQQRLALVELTREQARLEAMRLKVLSAADLDEVGAVDGSASTGAWLAHQTRTDFAEARGLVRLATVLERNHPATGRALAAGELSAAHARVIVRALAELPGDIAAELLARAEQTLVEEATQLCPQQLRILGRHLLEVIAPEVADQRLGQQLEREEQAAYARARFTMRRNGDGTSAGWFQVPDLHAGMLKTALEAITAPRVTTPAGANPDHQHPRPDYPTQLGQALCHLIEHLPVDALPVHGKTAATIVVTLAHETLTSALAAAQRRDGEAISAGEARRLACNAGIIPAVLGGPSTILDLGRESRLFSKAQMVALRLRDGGCRAETCDRPASWCEAHHGRDPWAKGGKTNLADGVLLCGHHHRLAHHPDYDHHRLPDERIRFHRRT
ncbi:MAG: HNH endonuclease [Actinomycetota bacterium]|nr:HNH endonuclease [Actinomycetota bacterium]